MKTGIQISNIPTKITEQSALEAEARRERASRSFDLNMGDMITGKIVDGNVAFSPPENRGILKFPTDDNRYVDNWMILRTVKREIESAHVLGEGGDGAILGATNSYNLDEMRNFGFGFNEENGKAWNTQCTIALYFPNGVKDTVSVEYEQQDVGLGDTILNNIFGVTEGQTAGFFEQADEAGREAFRAVANKMVSVKAMQEGVAANNPKFSNFGGVTLRDHTYTFNLNPYNVNDSRAITKIIEKLKMYSLPAMSAKNSRLKILPSEWSIDFQGPILGHIEHPQNCYLATVDVDYSGGKDMSFIEKTTAHMNPLSFEHGGEYDTKGNPIDDKYYNEDGTVKDEFYKGAMEGEIEHFPNGITLTLTFKEILQLNRQRYMERVAASAMGAKQKDTLDQLRDEAYFGKQEQKGTWDGDSWPVGPEAATFDDLEGAFGTSFAEDAFNREHQKWTNPFEADQYLQMTHGGPENYRTMQIVEPDGSQYWIIVPKTGMTYGGLRTGYQGMTEEDLNKEILGAWNKHHTFDHIEAINRQNQTPWNQISGYDTSGFSDEDLAEVYEWVKKNGTGKKTSP